MASRRSGSSSPAGRGRRSTDPVTAYAEDLVAGRAIGCKLAAKAAKRHVDDLASCASRGLVWNPDLAQHAIEFFGYLHHSKGELAGSEIVLEPWEAFCVGSVYGWLRADGTRRFRSAYLELPKKNGKSTLCAGVGIYGLVADDEPGAEVYAVATKRDQARIVFGEAQRMVRKSPQLIDLVSVRTLNMSVDETGSKFEPLSSDEKSGDGLNPSMTIVDELHRQKSAALRNLMEAGMVSRRQPLLWIITTAGDENPVSAYAIEHDYAIKVIERVLEDDSYFAFITTVDDVAKWDDPGEWAKANPNLGVSVKIDKLQELCVKAKQAPASKADFLRYHLNVRTSDSAKYIDMDVWRRNTGKGRINPDDLRGRVCYGGLDLSSKIDISARALLFPPLLDQKRWQIVARYWMPADTIEARAERDRAPYREWVDKGWIIATPGNVIDHGEIETTLIEDHKNFHLRGVGYDPWNATQLAVNLLEEGVPMFEFIQGLRSYTEPTKELEAMLIDGKLDHGEDPVLAWMASNLSVQTDKNLNRMPIKQKSTGRIDGMCALIMAIGRAIAPDGGGSAYEDRGLIVLD